MTSVSEWVQKRWPRCLELGAQLDVVEDLAVEDDPDRAVFVVDRLLAAREVDDAQARVRQPDGPLSWNPKPSGPR